MRTLEDEVFQTRGVDRGGALLMFWVPFALLGQGDLTVGTNVFGN